MGGDNVVLKRKTMRIKDHGIKDHEDWVVVCLNSLRAL